jgi:hypothetical protein
VDGKVDEAKRRRDKSRKVEDGIESRRIEDGIGKVGTGRGIWTAGSRNVEMDRNYLRSLDAAGGTSAEGAGKLKDVECRKRQTRGRIERRQTLSISIYDRYSEIRYRQDFMNECCDD